MASPPTLVLISGPEQLLADRALAQTVQVCRDSAPDAEVVRVDPSAYTPGELFTRAGPSLFGGYTVLVVPELDQAGDDLIDDVATLAGAKPTDITLVVLHRGGQRGKRALTALKKSGARVIQVPAMKSDRDKAGFVTSEFRHARRKITPDAVHSLLAATGKDLAELAAACRQLIADTDGVVGPEQVETYYGGRTEATGFKVAEAAIAGNAPEALRLLRWALDSGLDPVPIVAVLASQLRQVARVATAGGSSAAIASNLKMAPWQVDRARAAARGWDGVRLGRAIQAVAAADFEVKGGGRDPVYAVEHAVLQITRERTG